MLSYVDDKDGEKKQVSGAMSLLSMLTTQQPVTNCDAGAMIAQFISRTGIHCASKRK